jgi:hypothetical protein
VPSPHTHTHTHTSPRPYAQMYAHHHLHYRCCRHTPTHPRTDLPTQSPVKWGVMPPLCYPMTPRSAPDHLVRTVCATEQGGVCSRVRGTEGSSDKRCRGPRACSSEVSVQGTVQGACVRVCVCVCVCGCVCVCVCVCVCHALVRPLSIQSLPFTLFAFNFSFHLQVAYATADTSAFTPTAGTAAPASYTEPAKKSPAPVRPLALHEKVF